MSSNVPNGEQWAVNILRLYERNAPSFSADEIWEGVASRIRTARRVPARRRKVIRVAAIACAAAVLVAGIAVGVLQVAEHLRGGIQFGVSNVTEYPVGGSQQGVFGLSQVAFVELERQPQFVLIPEGYTGDRRILSPVADAKAVQQLLDAYAVAAQTAGGEDTLVTEPAETFEVVHFLDGSARTVTNPEYLDLADEMLAQPYDGQGATQLPAVMPEDFGFVAGFGLFGKSVLDTFAGKFYKDMIQPPWSTAMAPVGLGRQRMEIVYAAFREMNILAYDTDFAPLPGGTYVTPHDSYYLRVRAGGIDKEIRWNDEDLSRSTQATALRDWFGQLQRMLEEIPAYRELPEARGGYD